MATPDTPIDFTVGDQERLARIEMHLTVISKLPCLTDAPCPENDRISALEKSRERGLVGVATFIVGAALYSVKLLYEFFSGG